jgi:hypothetical protein
MAAGRPGGTPAEGLTAGQTEEVRTRVRLLIQITARAGKYRKGLLAAAAGVRIRSTPVTGTARSVPAAVQRRPAN